MGKVNKMQPAKNAGNNVNVNKITIVNGQPNQEAKTAVKPDSTKILLMIIAILAVIMVRPDLVVVVEKLLEMLK